VLHDFEAITKTALYEKACPFQKILLNGKNCWTLDKNCRTSYKGAI